MVDQLIDRHQTRTGRTQPMPWPLTAMTRACSMSFTIGYEFDFSRNRPRYYTCSSQTS
ncbi:hypothetical protein HanRHA438_Chr10g0470111 [Helianthus annuus]|nr:hypothetical protein HanIR_Chr10g0492681 [Helianthus annuus]KAJ0881058.1 hypothetical protein HanRHA438_Chr10g0470111 [Helianthus annuus]